MISTIADDSPAPRWPRGCVVSGWAWRSAGSCGNASTPARRSPRAFSSEVDTGSREENASKQESRAPFRFYRNGEGSSHDYLCESADILVGAVLPGSHRLEYREPVRRSQLFPLELVQVWCERFRVFLLPVGDTRSHPKES